MTDPHDPMDDLLRQSLADEVAGTEADDALLARIRTASNGTPAGRSARLWLVAALVALVAGTVAVLAQRHDEDTAPPTIDPTTTTIPTTSTSTTTSTAVDNPASHHPTKVAVVTEAGHLVVIDLSTGEATDLLHYDDPMASGSPASAHFIDAVDLAPDGDNVYFSVCCVTTAHQSYRGTTYRVPVGGGDAVKVADGTEPRVSPDGRWVATSADSQLLITPTPGNGGIPVINPIDQGRWPKRFAWSPTSDELSYYTEDPEGGTNPQIHTGHWDGTILIPVDPGKPDNPGQFVVYSPDGIPTRQLGEPVADDRSWSQDRTARWTLVVDGDGTVRWFETVGGSPEELPGVPKALSADW